MEKVLRIVIIIILTVASGLMPGCNKSDLTENNLSPKPMPGTVGQMTPVDVETVHEERKPESVISHLEDNVAKLNVEDAQELKTEYAETAEPKTAKQSEGVKGIEPVEMPDASRSDVIVIVRPHQQITTEQKPVLSYLQDTVGELRTENVVGPKAEFIVVLDDEVAIETTSEGTIEESKPEISETTDQEVKVAGEPQSVLSHLQKTLGGIQTESETNPAVQNELFLIAASEMGEPEKIEKVLKETQGQAAQKTQQENVTESQTVVAKNSTSEKSSQTILDAIRDILSVNRKFLDVLSTTTLGPSDDSAGNTDEKVK